MEVVLEKGNIRMEFKDPSNWIRITLIKEEQEIPIQFSMFELFYETIRSLEHDVK